MAVEFMGACKRSQSRESQESISIEKRKRVDSLDDFLLGGGIICMRLAVMFSLRADEALKSFDVHDSITLLYIGCHREIMSTIVIWSFVHSAATREIETFTRSKTC